MRCLSINQPWATLIALGAKHIETRSWSTSYRGPLAIHASSRMNREAALSLRVPAIREALSAGGYYQGSGPASNPCGLPLGAVIAVAMLVDVQPITPLNQGLTPGMMSASRHRLYELLNSWETFSERVFLSSNIFSRIKARRLKERICKAI